MDSCYATTVKIIPVQQLASTGQVLDSPLDGTFSYTTKLASSLLRVMYFAPVTV